MKYYLLYDDLCSFCRRFLDWVARRDKEGLIEPVGFRDPRLPQITPSLTGEKLFGSMHLVFPDGKILSGHRAMPKLLGLLPGLAWLAWLLKILPGADWLSGRIYDWIAIHRR